MSDTTIEPRQPNGERYDYNALCLATDAQLEQVMRMGAPPDMGGLVGWEFKGYNVFEASTLLGIRKFKEGFYLEDPERDPALGISGYNVQIHQNTLGEPWIDKTRKGEPIRHGWYDVYPVSLSEVDNKYPNALLINYGSSPKNFALAPCRGLRDYLVQVYPDNPDLLLGKATAAIGLLRLSVAFFVLERHNEAILQL
jgi:hypothetical protein